MIAYRQCDGRFPFLWEGSAQPAARWHGDDEGPVHYFADTPDGAWAEFVRHEEITDPSDLAGVRRAMWAVDVGEVDDLPAPRLPKRVLLGDATTYAACRNEARALRDRGEGGLVAPSAALARGQANGWVVNGGLRPGHARDGRTIALFGARPDLVGWKAADAASPPEEVLGSVRHFGTA